MTRLLKPSAPARGRFILASGLGVSLLAAGAIGQVSPGGGQEASAGGADRAAAPNTRVTQNESQGQASQPSPERVIVTGSFIPTAEGEGALPVAVFTQDDLRKQGSNSATEGLRRLPSFFGNASTEADSNGGNGQAGVNLRALGQQNVLILLNGHRAGNPSLLSGFTDANAIPFSAIDHIEVLKDGASATYGSDAVAGVVNYIFKTQYEGAQVDVYFGNTTNNDQSTFRAAAIAGFSTKDKRFNIVLDANYFHANSIESKDRFLSSSANTQGNRYGATPGLLANFPQLVGQPVRGALNLGGPNTASGTYPGRITVAAGGAVLGSTSLILRDNVPNGTANSPTVPTTLADYRPFSLANGDGFNFRLQTPAIPEQERFAYYGATDYQIIEKALDIYAFGLYSNNRQYNALASSPGSFGNFAIDPALNPALAAQFGTERALIRASPYNPAGAFLNTVSYRTFELGRRVTLFDTRFYYGAIGVKGELLRTFNYDVTFLHEEDKQIRTDSGDARRSVLLREIATGGFNPFIGGGAPNAGTLNGFSYDNAAALGRASYIGETVLGFNNLNLIESRLSNTFFPDAPQGGVSLAVGAEYRREAFDAQFDPTEQSGDTFGFTAGASFHAVQDVRSIFGEMRFPIVIPTMKVPGIYNLAFTVAGRYQKFFLNGQDPISVANGAPRGVTPTFETTNPKYAFEYQPIQDIKFRGSYSTAFRAPSLADFFQPAVAGADFPQITDPYTLSPGGTTYQPLNGDTTGGNANLQPENTDAYSIGLVVTPRWIKGLTFTADYYQLNQKQVIIQGANIAQFVVQQNFNTSNKAYFGPLGIVPPGTPNGGLPFNDPAASFAARVVRDPETGQLLSVDETPLNAARRSVEGIDVTLFYELDTMDLFKKDFGKFNFNVAYNHVFRFNAQVSPGQGFTDFTGQFSAAPLTPGSIPYNKAQFQLEYQKNIGPGLLDFVATVNYIGDFLDDGGSLNGSTQVVDQFGNPQDPANPVFSKNRKVREYTTLDLQLSYTFKAPEPLTTTTASKDYKGKAVAPAPVRGASLWQKILGGTTLTVGCIDVFDTPPPFAAGAFNDNYDTSLYSIRNRFVYGAVSKKF